MIFGALTALQIASILLAARAKPLPRILLVPLAYALADGLLVESLHRFLFTAPKWPVWHAIQRHGWPALAAYHVETAVVLGWPALLAAAAWRVFAGTKSDRPEAASCRPEPVSRGVGSATPGPARGSGFFDDRGHLGPSRRVPTSPIGGRNRAGHQHLSASAAVKVIFGAWLIAAGGLAACHPLPIGWTAPVLHAAEVFFVVAALSAIPVGWRRRTIVTPEGQAVGLLGVVELVVCVLGAWAWGARVFDAATWDSLARVPYAIGWAVLCGILWRCRSHCPLPSSSSPP